MLIVRLIEVMRKKSRVVMVDIKISNNTARETKTITRITQNHKSSYGFL